MSRWGAFSWNEEYVVIFCDVCINFVAKNGRGKLFKWREIQNRFEDNIGRTCDAKILKNKYDAMKKDWRLWKFLKSGESGLNFTSGKLDCSDEWWERKLKERPEAKKFRNKGVSPVVEERWDQLFGDLLAICDVATGENCVAPSMNPEFVDKPINEVEVDEIQDEEGGVDAANCELPQDSNKLESVDDKKDSFVNGNATPSPESNSTNTKVVKPTKAEVVKPTKGVKRGKRDSGESFVMRQQHINKLNEVHSGIMGLIKQGTKTKIDEGGISIDQIIEIMNRIVANNDVEVGGELWCHAMFMFRDSISREIFFKMPSDAARLAWLKFAQTKNII